MVLFWSRNAHLIDPEYSAKPRTCVKLELAVPNRPFGAVRAVYSVVGSIRAAKLPSRIAAPWAEYEGIALVMRV